MSIVRMLYGPICVLLVAACGVAPHRDQVASTRTERIGNANNAKVATYQGCPVFAPSDAYNQDISDATMDPKSAEYIASMVSGGDNVGGFEATTGYEKVNLATSATPHLTIRQKVPWHAFPHPYPWQPSFYIEKAPSDQHAMVLQTDTCHLYESYGTVYAARQLSAYSGADWDLTKPYTKGSINGSSSNAAGTPFFAGMVKWEEYRAGSIDHALNFAPTLGSIAQYGHVPPAFTNATSPYVGSVSPQIPYGAHLRLKASFDISGYPPEAKAIAHAMKTYGIFITDTGGRCCPNQLYLANALDGSDPWDAGDLSALSSVRITDFEVLKLPPIER